MGRTSQHITEMAIRNLRVREGKPHGRIYDGRGLFVYRLRRGARMWKLRYKDEGGHDRWMTLGEYPAMGLKDARARAGEIRNKIRLGVDPKRERDLRQTRDTFHDGAIRWIGHAGAGWTEKTRNIADTWMKADVFPVIGHLPMDDVEILKILRRVDAALGRSQELTRLCSQELTRRMRSDLHSILSI